VVNYSSVPEVKDVIAGGSGTDIVFDHGSGEKSIITYKPVSGYGWGVVMQELYSEAFSTMSSLLFVIMFLIISTILVDVIISYALFRYFILHEHE
jgi:hypothetical protein